MDGKVWDGVQSLLDAYIVLEPADIVIVLYTVDSQSSATLVSAALEMRQTDYRRVCMTALHDPNFPEKLRVALPQPADLIGRLVILSFERDTFSHSGVLLSELREFPPQRVLVFRAISACDALFSDALRIGPAALTARNTSLLERLLPARQLRIVTGGGTDLKVKLDSNRHRWISNRGLARPGGTVVLPAGEVATFPASVSGVHVADFAFNINAITDRDVRLDRRPVTLTIRDSRVCDYCCEDADMIAFLDQCFVTECSGHVGELGFGTNSDVGEPIAMNSHINERRPGVHLGFGQHNQDPGVVGYQCAIHLDLIARGGLVWCDDDLEPIDLEAIVPSNAKHPDITRDEDVFSPDMLDVTAEDCCGVLQSGGVAPLCPLVQTE
jgi:hypothetical protein